MIETKVTRMLGIKYPIIGGTMMWISDADFVAAISNAGGLGILASAMYDSREAFADAIDRIKTLTDKPFCVNINLFPAMRQMDNAVYMEGGGPRSGGGILPGWRSIRKNDWMLSLDIRDEKVRYLYDLETDPFQMTNLSGKREFRGEETALKNALYGMKKELKDDLW